MPLKKTIRSLPERAVNLISKSPTIAGLATFAVAASTRMNEFFYNSIVKCTNEPTAEVVNQFGAPLITGLFVYILGHERRRIEETKKSQEDLEQAKLDLEKIINTMGDGLMWLDHDNRLKKANPAICEVLGYSESELIGKSIEFWTEEKALEEMKVQLQRRKQGEKSSYESIFKNRDGQKIPVFVTGAAIRSPSGIYLGAVGCIKDMTEIKNKRAENEALREQLVQAEKLKAIGEVAGGIAHDFNNHLTVIGASLDGVNASLAQDRMDDVKEYLSYIRTSYERSRDLVKNILNFARAEKYSPKPVNLARDLEGFCREASQLIASTGNKCEINFEFNSSKVVSADLSAIGNALSNLIKNAGEAVQEKARQKSDYEGRIIVEVRDIHLNSALESYERIPVGDYVRVSVTDNGAGIPEDFRKKIFLPLFTTKEKGKGTGFGLANVLRTIRAHSGYIDVQTLPEMGTTFSLYLPVITEKDSKN